VHRAPPACPAEVPWDDRGPGPPGAAPPTLTCSHVAMASAALKSLIKPKAPPAPKYKEYCLAPKFGAKMKVPGVCLRVPEKITVDFKDRSKMDLPGFKLVKPAGTA